MVTIINERTLSIMAMYLQIFYISNPKSCHSAVLISYYNILKFHKLSKKSINIRIGYSLSMRNINVNRSDFPHSTYVAIRVLY